MTELIGGHEIDRKSKTRMTIASRLGWVLSLSTALFVAAPCLADDTGFKDPTSTGSPKNDFPTTGNAYTSNDSDDIGDNSDMQDYADFGFGVAAGSTVTGIEVVVEWAGEDVQECEITLELSYDGGNNYTVSEKLDIRESITDSDSTFGGANDTWGRGNWTDGEVSDANFRVRIEVTDGNPDVAIDWIRVKVYYFPNTAPTAATLSDGVQTNDGTGMTVVSVDIDDGEDNSCEMRVEYSVDGKTTWTNAHIDSIQAIDFGATPNINNGAANYQIGDATPITTASGANTVTFKWDTQNGSNGESTITTGYIAAVWIRVKANDSTEDGAWVTNGSSFVIDNLAPVNSEAVHLEDATPTSGDTSFQLDVIWTESNPGTNIYGYKLNGAGGYTEAGGDDLANSAPLTFNVGLDGNDYFNGIRCVHTDDYGNVTTNEDPTTVYVAPTNPATPTVNNPSSSSLDVTILTNSPPDLLYAIFETNTTQYVQSDKTLGGSIFWTNITGWGSTLVTVGSLSSSTAYKFSIAAGNPNDTTPTTGENSASLFGGGAEDTTSAAVPVLDQAYVGATNITTTNAWIIGNLTTNGGIVTTVTIYYGDNDAGATNTGWDYTNTLGILTSGAFSTNITTGIESNTYYYYVIHASNGDGESWITESMPFATGPWLLPFEDDFETAPPTRRLGELSGQNGWQVSTTGVATIQDSITYSSSAGAMKIEGMGSSTVSHPIDEPAATNIVWIDMYTRPVRSPSGTPPSDASGCWYVNTNGTIVAYDGTTATALTNASTVAINTWVRFTARADYNTRTWDFYYEATSVATNFSFYNTNNESCTSVFVSAGNTNGASLYVDNVYVGLTAPLGISTAGPGWLFRIK